MLLIKISFSRSRSSFNLKIFALHSLRWKWGICARSIKLICSGSVCSFAFHQLDQHNIHLLPGVARPTAFFAWSLRRRRRLWCTYGPFFVPAPTPTTAATANALAMQGKKYNQSILNSYMCSNLISPYMYIHFFTIFYQERRRCTFLFLISFLTYFFASGRRRRAASVQRRHRCSLCISAASRSGLAFNP